MKPASDSVRLFACLTASCLLHAGLLFMPYLGASSAYRPAVQGGRKPAPPRVLSVTLEAEKEKNSAFTVAAVPTDGESMAASPTERTNKEQPRPASDRTVGIGLLPIPAPAYYTTDQLTKRPQPIGAAELDTPEIRPIIASGTIVLKLWINELGNVTSVDVEKSDLPPMFSETAAAAFRNLHFVPGQLDGRPVGTVMRIEITYDDGRRPPP
jgi:TonB family protein